MTFNTKKRKCPGPPVVEKFANLEMHAGNLKSQFIVQTCPHGQGLNVSKNNVRPPFPRPTISCFILQYCMFDCPRLLLLFPNVQPSGL